MGKDRESLFNKRKGNKKKRKENIKKQSPNKYLIVTEGEATEPNYFEYYKTEIENKYNTLVELDKHVNLDVEGTGRNTLDLVKYTEKLVNQSPNIYGNIWLVFDKDDFPDEQFNNSITKAQSNGYKVAWSNESFELWYLLHFQDYESTAKRTDYITKLNGHYKRLKIANNKYEKNDKNIMKNLNSVPNSRKNAIRRCKKLVKDNKDQRTPSKMKPVTMVFELVEELLKYLK